MHKIMGIRLVVVAVAALSFIAPTIAVPRTVPAFTARNLVHGSEGNDVYELQNRLRFLGYYHGKVDGIFGWDTYWAVRNFQARFGLKPTGRVDMPTKIKLVKATRSWTYHAPSPSIPTGSAGGQSGTARNSTPGNPNLTTQTPAVLNGISGQDINLMAHAVNGEARGEPYKGQVAIAAVILNRLRDPRFPHSIPAIIYQPGAFTAVTNGQMNLPPQPSAVRAVMDAVQGWDPSMGAVYYFNPATATSRWIWSRPQITKIGKHIFER